MPELEDPLLEVKADLDAPDRPKASNIYDGADSPGGGGHGEDNFIARKIEPSSVPDDQGPGSLYHGNNDQNSNDNENNNNQVQVVSQEFAQDAAPDTSQDAPQVVPQNPPPEAVTRRGSQDASHVEQQFEQENLAQEGLSGTRDDDQVPPSPPPSLPPSQHGHEHEQHESSSTRQTMTSAEELQLAAQLSQDISQSMPSTLLDSASASASASASNSVSASASASADVDVPVNVDGSNLQNSISGLAPDEHRTTNIQQHHEEPLHEEQHLHQHAHNQHLPPNEHDQSLQVPDQHLQNHGLPLQNHDPSAPPHHDGSLQHVQQPQHHFLPTAHQQQHRPQHQQPIHPAQPLPQHSQPNVPLGHPMQHYGPPITDNTPPRKRSKVSRACDECRRKKVKCDATSENGEEPCSNCRRSGITCLFSRIPQKRGPSKGYIKELADRIHSIEGKLASEGGNVDALSEILSGARRESSDIFSPTGQPDENSRKRPYSSISTGDFGTPASSRQAAWSSEPRPIQPFPPSGRPYSVNGLAPQPLGKPDADTSSKPAAVMDGLSLELEQNGAARELDDGAFTGYLNVVHQCYPLLAASKTRVEERLLQCPPLLRDAFVEALYGTMQSFVSVPGLYTNGDISSASRLITEWESDSSPRTLIMNLVHLQTLILTAIATDNYGPSSLKGEHGGASKSSVLGRAVGLAYSMRLHVRSMDTNSEIESDLDSDENVAIRAWWTLIMLDRWNAISTSSPLFIPNDSVVILPSLRTLLGEGVFHLARLSNILGHFAPVSLAPSQALSPASGVAPILSSFFNLSMELFREVLPSEIEPATHPILHLVYWHSRLLAYLYQTNSRSVDILWPCKESVALLLTNAQVLSPLNHHFFCLTTLTLLELSKVEGAREEANGLLKELLDSNHAPSTWDGAIRGHIVDRLRPAEVQAAMGASEATTNQNLQHLANLATASKADPGPAKPAKVAGTAPLRTSDDYEDVGFDPRVLTRGGYLNVLVESRPAVGA